MTSLTNDLLKRFSPLGSLSNHQLTELLGSCELLNFSTGKKVFKRGDTSKSCYYLVEGTLDLIDIEFNITKLQGGESEACHILDHQEPHTCSAVTTSDCILLKINKDKMDLVLTWNQAGSYLVAELQEDEEEAVENDWMSSLLQSSLFQNIPPANIQQLFVKFSSKPVRKGDIIVQEGDYGEEFFVIESGQAEVKRKMAGGEAVTLARLMPGQFFGQEALIGETTRNASVVMSSDGNLMKLGKDDFKNLLQTPVLNYVTVEDMHNLVQSGHNVKRIDVRLPIEYSHNKVENCRNIPLSDLRAKFDSLDEETTYVISCDGGRRCELGAYLLNEAGYQAVVLKN